MAGKERDTRPILISLGVEGLEGDSAMTISELLRRPRKQERTPDPEYMETGRFDGRRSVNRKKFIKNPQVREQIKDLAESARNQ